MNAPDISSHESFPFPNAGFRGFTLIELLAAIAIVGMLAVLSLAGWNKVVRSADSAQCLSNLRQIGTAILQYSADHDGLLPGPCDNSIRTTYRVNNGDLGAFLAPYWDLPSADTVTRSARPLMCSAWKRTMKAPEGKCYWSPFRLKGFYNPGNPTGYYSPFGKGQPDGHPLRLQSILSISGFAAGKQWMIQDFDKTNASQLSIDGQAPVPVHGTVRNVLYFDFHAESLPVSTVLD